MNTAPPRYPGPYPARVPLLARLRSRAIAARAWPPYARIVALARTLGLACGPVGGAVRDWALGRGEEHPLDLDLLWEGELEFLASAAEAWGWKVRRNLRYRTLLLRTPTGRIDVAAPRRDRYPIPGAVPLVAPADLRTDLARRDFTTNALYLRWTPPEPELVDPEGGIEDLRRGWLRPVRPGTLAEDPIRVVRGARYLERFGWRPVGWWHTGLERARAPVTWRSVAPGRLWREAERIADEPDPVAVWQRLAAWGLDRTFLGVPLPAEVTAAWRRWRTRLGPEPRDTGRNWLIDLVLLERLRPEAARHWFDLATPPEDRWRRYQKARAVQVRPKRFAEQLRAALALAISREADAPG